MNLIFLGAPGVGKGTIADLVSKRLNVPHISTGDIFRKIREEDSELGRLVKNLIDNGKFVPDDVTIKIVEQRLKEKDCRNGYILDGFPRTLPQAEALKKITNIDYVINFDLDEDYIVKRLLARRNCPVCKKNYNLMTSMRPKKDGVCDVDGAKLVARADDTEEIIRDRQETYKRQTKPLIDFYKKEKLIINVDASEEPAEIEKRVMDVF